MFTGGATAPAFKLAHSFLPLPGQTHCASAEKQYGVSPFFSTRLGARRRYFHTVYAWNIYWMTIDSNINIHHLNLGLQPDTWLFHLKVVWSQWDIQLMTRLWWILEWKEQISPDRNSSVLWMYSDLYYFPPHPSTFLRTQTVSLFFISFYFLYLIFYFPPFGLQLVTVVQVIMKWQTWCVFLFYFPEQVLPSCH